MKYMIFLAAAMFATTMNATTEYTEAVAENDTVVVIDNSADDEIIGEFVKTNDEFDAKSRKHATYEDCSKAFAGNSSVPVVLDARPQRGFFVAPSLGLMATLGSNSFFAPKFGVEGGYEGNRHALYGALYYLKARPNEQSDLQGRFDALSAEFGYAYFLGQWMDHSLRLAWRSDAVFQTTVDRQDLGTSSSTSVQETETEIITTRESEWRAYKVNPFMFGAKTGLELSYQPHMLPIAISAGANVGFISQIAGKESVNGSNDGIGYKLTVEGKITFRVYLSSKSKNMKAKNMIRH